MLVLRRMYVVYNGCPFEDIRPCEYCTMVTLVGSCCAIVVSLVIVLCYSGTCLLAPIQFIDV